MFDRSVDYPTAVASYDDNGVSQAVDWCIQHMEDGDILTVWTSLKSNLRNCTALEQLVIRHSNVDHMTGRGRSYLHGHGPVLMAWPRMDDIGELARSASHVRALAVITWSEDEIRPWVTAMGPDILGNGSAWENSTPDIEPVVVEALKSMTLVINHNNTISAGYEKDCVVSGLLALRDARIPMDPAAIQGWALAHGWSGKNPERLAAYVRDINAGKRPRASRVLGADYIGRLRERVAEPGDDAR